MAEIMANELDPNFKLEVAARLGGANIKRCFACGACTGSCPASQVVEEFDPRKIIHMIILGLREQVLSSPIIWYCLLCNTCSFVCPQDVRFSEAMSVLRQMAVKEGYVSSSFQKRLEAIEELNQKLRAEMLRCALSEKDKKEKSSLKQLLEEACKKCI
ncbi:MAG TPA: 4Fe-4S ferredoxin [Syntrophaceae bacterium]|nr:4Fe-4S ferredoxin [Syntrophaceae bacterium]